MAVPILRATILSRTVRTKVDGYSLTIRRGVFHPKLFSSSVTLGRYVSKLTLSGKKVLDMGTGSGIIGLYAASRGAVVTAVDVSPVAVECARENFAALGFGDRVSVVLSDLFEGFSDDENWEYIFWNPPFYPRKPVSFEEAAWYAGLDYEVLRRFSLTAGTHLPPDGRIIMVFSSDVDTERVLGLFTAAGFASSEVFARKTFLETFRIFSLSRA